MLRLSLLVVAVFRVGCLALPPHSSIVFPPPTPDVFIDYGNANFYIDMFLRQVNKALPDYVPIPDIPDAPFGANNCSILGTAYGLQRDGDATVVMVDNTAMFAATFRMQDVGIFCDFKVLVDKGSGSGMVSYVTIAADISWLLEHGQHPWLTEFKVTDMDQIVVTVDGFFGLNWIIEDIADWIANNAAPTIVNIIETDVSKVFQAVLDKFVIP